MCCPKIRPTHPPSFNSLNTKISCILKPHMWCWHTPFHKGTTHTFSLVSGHTASVADMHTTRHPTTSFASHHNGVCATPCLIHPFPHKYNTYFSLVCGQSSSVAAACTIRHTPTFPFQHNGVCHTPHTPALNSCHHVVCVFVFV